MYCWNRDVSKQSEVVDRRNLQNVFIPINYEPVRVEKDMNIYKYVKILSNSGLTK